MRKIIDGIAIVSGVGFLAILGSGTYGYFWFQNNKDTFTQQIIEQVTKDLPIPKLTGPANPTAVPRNLNIPRF